MYRFSNYEESLILYWMTLVPYDLDKRIMEAQTAKTKDQEPVIKMVTPVDQATEMAMAELKREWDALQRKT